MSIQGKFRIAVWIADLLDKDVTITGTGVDATYNYAKSIDLPSGLYELEVELTTWTTIKPEENTAGPVLDTQYQKAYRYEYVYIFPGQTTSTATTISDGSQLLTFTRADFYAYLHLQGIADIYGTQAANYTATELYIESYNWNNGATPSGTSADHLIPINNGRWEVYLPSRFVAQNLDKINLRFKVVKSGPTPTPGYIGGTAGNYLFSLWQTYTIQPEHLQENGIGGSEYNHADTIEGHGENNYDASKAPRLSIAINEVTIATEPHGRISTIRDSDIPFILNDISEGGTTDAVYAAPIAVRLEPGDNTTEAVIAGYVDGSLTNGGDYSIETDATANGSGYTDDLSIATIRQRSETARGSGDQRSVSDPSTGADRPSYTRYDYLYDVSNYGLLGSSGGGNTTIHADFFVFAGHTTRYGDLTARNGYTIDYVTATSTYEGPYPYAPSPGDYRTLTVVKTNSASPAAYQIPATAAAGTDTSVSSWALTVPRNWKVLNQNDEIAFTVQFTTVSGDDFNLVDANLAPALTRYVGRSQYSSGTRIGESNVYNNLLARNSFPGREDAPNWTTEPILRIVRGTLQSGLSLPTATYSVKSRGITILTFSNTSTFTNDVYVTDATFANGYDNGSGPVTIKYNGGINGSYTPGSSQYYFGLDLTSSSTLGGGSAVENNGTAGAWVISISAVYPYTFVTSIGGITPVGGFSGTVGTGKVLNISLTGDYSTNRTVTWNAARSLGSTVTGISLTGSGLSRTLNVTGGSGAVEVTITVMNVGSEWGGLAYSDTITINY
ncbi:hypothetical protein AGMMS4952_24760 [Spirochaetia bacterium]|nr:hypothetical protein AGMMS4952_24760 [Spirochaetia bacterium]